MYLKFIKKHRKMSTCNQLDLETLGSWLILPKTVPGHLSKSTYMVDAISLAICKFLGRNTRVTIVGNVLIVVLLQKPKMKKKNKKLCFPLEM